MRYPVVLADISVSYRELEAECLSLVCLK